VCRPANLGLNLIMSSGNAGSWLACPLQPEREETHRFGCSEAIRWAWEDLNLRPHPERRIARVSTINGSCRTKESRAWPGTPDSHSS
jgi:hypothetical protein